MRNRLAKTLPWQVRGAGAMSRYRANGVMFMSHLHSVASKGLHIRTAFDEQANDCYVAENVCEYIQKNRVIPTFYLDIDSNPQHHEQYLQRMVSIFTDNRFDATLFYQLLENPNCSRYLLYLIERKKIPLWQGMTLYHYVMAAGQFTEFQSLSAKDMDVKSLRNISLVSMVSGRELTEAGKDYVNSISKMMASRTIFPLDVDALVKFIINSPQTEQYLLKIENYPYKDDDVVHDFIRILRMNAPFFMDSSVAICNFPPTTIMNYIFTTMSARPMRARPIVGSVGVEKIADMHGMDLHPVVIYSRDIKSNVYEVHGRRCGGFPAMMHDWSHIYWANLLGPEERDYLTVSLTKLFRDIQAAHPHSKLSTAIDEICISLNDFDLSGSFQFDNKESRLHNYVLRVISRNLFDNNATTVDDDMVVIGCIKKFIDNENDDGRSSAFLKQLCRTLDKHMQMSLANPNEKISMSISRFFRPEEEGLSCDAAALIPEGGVAAVSSVVSKQ